MRTRTEYPEEIREHRTVWIPMSDGVRLAARMWIPVTADTRPVPAIIEYLPYRRGDGTASRDRLSQPYLAGNGYACLRIDIRGSGDSDGSFEDEYTEQEQTDCVAVIAWVAAQPWCSGTVGMWGISWGGFNALQVAARRPPALKAIITVCSTDDRYADDTHYMGGALLLGNLNWGASMFAIATQPPDPEVVGDGWEAIWRERLEAIPHLVPIWTAHQRRDAYWRQGSVCEDYASIQCAVFAVGGWADSYTNAIPRLVENLTCPRLGLIGPWAHAYPHIATPGPAIGFLQESLRWWDHWLKGAETGIMDEPRLRSWMQEPMPPASHYETLPGRWVGDTSWPPKGRKNRRFRLSDTGLTDAPGAASPIRIATAQGAGMAAGAWCPYGFAGDLPGDQRIEDGDAVCWDSMPMDEAIEVLGAPLLTARVSSDRPNALLVARLSLLATDGAATRISYGVLNLTHRDGHAEPAPLEPGRGYDVEIRLNDIGQRIPAGWRLRLALQNAYWPTVWPSPEAAVLTLDAQACHLDLPLRDHDPAAPRMRPFDPPESSPPAEVETLRPASRAQHAELDLTGDGVNVIFIKDRGAERDVASGMVRTNRGEESYVIRRGDPLSARGEMRWHSGLARGDWSIRTETVTVQTATATAFRIDTRLDAWSGDRHVFGRHWSHEIARDLV